MELVSLNLDRATYGVVGRVLESDVTTSEGLLLLREGVVVQQRHLSLLKKNNVDKIVVGEPVHVVDQVCERIGEKDPGFAYLYKENFFKIKGLFKSLKEGDSSELVETMSIFSDLVGKSIRSNHAVEVLQQLQGHNDYTYRHSIHVGIYASLIAKLAGFLEDDIRIVGEAGFIHDIGKIRVSNAIIDKPGKLTDEEYGEIKKHSELGYDLLLNTSVDVSEDVLDGVLYHHERLDGTGYPFGIVGDDIPKIAQVLAVADVFDAISSDRVYRKGMNPLRSLGIIRDDIYRGKLSADYGLLFIKYMLDVYTGSVVLFSDGRYGKLIQLYKDDVGNPLVWVEGEILEMKQLEGIEIIEVLGKYGY